MRDYQGDMRYFQDQLAHAGITKDMVDMDNFTGLTYRELQSIVDYQITLHKQKQKESKTQ